MVIKINVSIPEDVLKELDKAAHEANSSRSALLTQAAKSYLEREEEKKKRIRHLKAAERIIEIAEEIGPWDGTAELLKWRNRH